MKKIIKLKTLATVCFVATLIFTSCTKAGPVGPAGSAGPTGATGATGPSNVAVVDSFYVPSSAWVNTGTGEWKYTYSNSNITEQIVSKGTVEVFGWSTAYPDWYAWPDVVVTGGGYRYYYNVGILTLLADNFSSAPASQSIKAVLLQ